MRLIQSQIKCIPVVRKSQHEIFHLAKELLYFQWFIIRLKQSYMLPNSSQMKYTSARMQEIAEQDAIHETSHRNMVA